MKIIRRRILVAGALASIVTATGASAAELSVDEQTGPWVPESCAKELRRVYAELGIEYELVRKYIMTLPATGDDRRESEILRDMNTLISERLYTAAAFADAFNAVDAASTKALAVVLNKWLSATIHRCDVIVASNEAIKPSLFLFDRQTFAYFSKTTSLIEAGLKEIKNLFGYVAKYL